MIVRLPSRWQKVVLVCAKCEKKLGNAGFGSDGRKSLSKALRRRAGGGKGRKAALGVISTRCLKVCPKGAVTMVDGTRPRDWLIVSAGTPLAEVEAWLGLIIPPSAK